MRKRRFHWLAEFINTKRYKIGAEIGTAVGTTTSHVLRQCKELTKYYVVDDWRPVTDIGPTVNPIWQRDGMEELWIKKCRNVRSRIVVLKGISWEMAENVKDGSLDFVFIDASHDRESFCNDGKAWYPKVRKGGLFSGHDIHIDSVRQVLIDLKIPYIDSGIDHCWYIIK